MCNDPGCSLSRQCYFFPPVWAHPHLLMAYHLASEWLVWSRWADVSPPPGVRPAPIKRPLARRQERTWGMTRERTRETHIVRPQRPEIHVDLSPKPEGDRSSLVLFLHRRELASWWPNPSHFTAIHHRVTPFLAETSVLCNCSVCRDKTQRFDRPDPRFRQKTTSATQSHHLGS